jgi:formate--tetrahydrofolate ligase
VQTLAGNLALIHGGPFANIAHGCNSLFATKTAMNISEYTITEAGFGSDLGAEKFVDIVCDNGQLNPNLIVLVTSIRSLKMHGGEDNKTNLSGNHRLVLGMNNLKQHIKNIKNFNLPFIVVINQFDTDKQTELKILKDFLEENKIQYSFTTLFKKGVSGAMDLAKKVLSLIDSKEEIKFIYKRNDKLDNKIHQIVTKCYGALGVEYSTKAQNQMKKLINTKA